MTCFTIMYDSQPQYHLRLDKTIYKSNLKIAKTWTKTQANRNENFDLQMEDSIYYWGGQVLGLKLIIQLKFKNHPILKLPLKTRSILANFSPSILNIRPTERTTGPRFSVPYMYFGHLKNWYILGNHQLSARQATEWLYCLLSWGDL